MGLLTGKASFVVFDAVNSGDDAQRMSSGDIIDKINAFSFKDIDESYDEFSAGWTSCADYFDTSFAKESPLVGDYVAASLRIDQRKVQGAVLKKFVAKEQRRTMMEKQVSRLSRGARMEIKDRVSTELKRKAKPTPTVTDFFWDLERGKVFVFSTNKGVLEYFADLFKQSFGVVLSGGNWVEPDANFLTWLWYKSDTSESGLVGNARVSIGDKVALEGDGDGSKVTCSSEAELKEGKKGIELGKNVTQAQLNVSEYSLTLSSLDEYKMVRLPRTEKAEGAEGFEGVILERIYLFSHLVGEVESLKQVYRYDIGQSSWGDVVGNISAWAAGN